MCDIKDKLNHQVFEEEFVKKIDTNFNFDFHLQGDDGEMLVDELADEIWKTLIHLRKNTKRVRLQFVLDYLLLCIVFKIQKLSSYFF